MKGAAGCVSIIRQWEVFVLVDRTKRFMSGIVVAALLTAAENSKAELSNKPVLEGLRSAPGMVVLAESSKFPNCGVELARKWSGQVCAASIRNTNSFPVRVLRVDLFALQHHLPGNTPIYGEGFQLLAQNGGTLAKPEDWGSNADRSHYRLEEPEGLRTVHGMMMLWPADDDPVLMGFASCRRFDGRISFDASRLLVSLDCEGIALAPGESWDLEEFYCESGVDREGLLRRFAERIERNHPRRNGFKTPPMGWCSWYAFGPRVTGDDIRRNLAWIATNAPQLRYIQIDDGYQPWMGDWMETGKSFGGNVRSVIEEIGAMSFEPAIWVAPFVASPESKLFKAHPDWFVKGDDGQPLRSDRVGFGGWRLGPWYALDGTHPGAQDFLEQTFRTMRREWGCTYFKLDAIYWGALHKGRFHDPKATRIEAYRLGMAAILRGAGDAFVLGCNQPMWASFGLLDGARSSMDVSRSWQSIRDTGRQNLRRGWQNGRLWWNDPDCLLVQPGIGKDGSGKTTAKRQLPQNEVEFLATVIHASGGMLLSGDDLTIFSPEQKQLLGRLIPPAGVAATFRNETLSVGRRPHGRGELFYLFNWTEAPMSLSVEFKGLRSLKNFWTGGALGEYDGSYSVADLPPHTAMLIESMPLSPPINAR